MSIISIPDYSDKNGAVFYEVRVNLPLRSVTVHKRYNDFVELVTTLSGELGLAPNDFPYKLPSKATLFSSKRTVSEMRKVQLCDFLNEVVKDRDLQNRIIVHRFLQLPKNFKFTRELFKEDASNGNDDKFLIDEDVSHIEKDQWLSYFRIVKSSVNKLDKGKGMSSQVESRERIQKYIKPNMDKLSRSLTHLSSRGLIDKHEFSTRKTRLAQLQNDIDNFLTNQEELFRESTKAERLVGRVFGTPDNTTPRETNETVALDNRSLLQQQQQIHLQQDQEVEQLRKIIARQRHIGQAINNEVEEQNEMLDRFSEELETSSQKLHTARSKAKRIL